MRASGTHAKWDQRYTERKIRKENRWLSKDRVKKSSGGTASCWMQLTVSMTCDVKNKARRAQVGVPPLRSVETDSCLNDYFQPLTVLLDD